MLRSKWSPGQRAELLGLLCTLVGESHALHDVLEDREDLVSHYVVYG